MAQEYQLFLKGWVGGWDFDADYVDYVLSRHTGKEVHVLINSLGGTTDTAFSVAAAFARHGNVHVHYSAMNASAATIAGMGAKRITIDADASWLVHDCRSVVDICKVSTASDIARLAESLTQEAARHEKIDSIIAGMYSRRCNRTPEELRALMDKEEWLTAEEALEWGFVDEVIEPEKPAAAPADSVICAMKEAGIPIPRKYRQPTLTERITESVATALENLGFRKPKTVIEENMNTQETTQAAETTQAPEATAAPAETNQAPEATASAEETPADAPDEVAALRSEIATLKATIAEMGKQPGATTSSVTEEPAARSGSLDSFVSDVASATAALASIGL